MVKHLDRERVSEDVVNALVTVASRVDGDVLVAVANHAAAVAQFGADLDVHHTVSRMTEEPSRHAALTGIRRATQLARSARVGK